MKKRDRLELKNSGKIYEVSGYWCEDMVLTPLDDKDEECLVYSLAEAKELFQEVAR